MKKTLVVVTPIVLAALSAAVIGQGQGRGFTPVTRAMLLNPSPDDWLMFSRTYDAQRYSPLNQINKQNVGRLTQIVDQAAGGRCDREHSDRATGA